MTRQEIEAELQKHDGTLLSFPQRGPWGCNKYRGNCSGWIQAFLIWKYKIQRFAELFSGSGTGYDVCKDMNIPYIGADLNPTPQRPGILQVNALTDDVPELFSQADMIFMHPPYGAEIKIPYAGSMYPDPTGELSKADLGQKCWDVFMNELNQIIMKYYSAMKPGAYMGVLMGDVRRGGFHSMFTDIVKPGQMEQIYIKGQHNCVSDGRAYASRNFAPIEHEFLMVLKKVEALMVSFQLPLRKELDIRDSKTATWRDVVAAVLRKAGRAMHLSEIYEAIKGHAKCLTNSNWEAKIRQVLQQFTSLFKHIDNGVWAIV